ncbi:P-loop containing nucleoside triphosphate hydrolase [Vibrio phage 1.121.O._10N.286.46.C4]|nr:P-loop containing nucleoside triphosphate hydrolase [Vibrio phage 1.121.O._10N.286.46.C4]
MRKGFSKKAKVADSANTEKKDFAKFVPTDEQAEGRDLISLHDMVKIGACAGSGKSSSLYYYGYCNPVPSLGLVFNKSMAMEAKSKSPDNIQWLTTHSLAYKEFGSRYVHKLSRPNTGRYKNVAITGTEIAAYFKLPDFPAGSKVVTKNFVGLIVRDTVNRFETSAEDVMDKRHIPYMHIKDLEDRFGKNIQMDRFKSLVLRRAKELWEERIDTYSDVVMTHNTYLKLYAMSNPDLSKYKVIYVDESQDINPVTMKLITDQKGKCKIIWVGDKFQSIYGFNNAINAMAKINCPEATLTQSFRFGEKIAQVATTILRSEMVIKGNPMIDSVVGEYEDEVVDISKPYTILFRTNMELIYTSVELILEGKSVNMNIDLRDFINMISSASELQQGNIRKVKHESIVPYGTWEELKEEAKNDRELKRCVKIIEEGQLDRILDTLRNHRNEENAHITLTTAHKAKGLEWNQVVLAEDFPSNYNHKGKWVGLDEQERNLLYVASTRAMLNLQVNPTVKELLDYDHVGDLSKKNTSRKEVVLETIYEDSPAGEEAKHRAYCEENDLPNEGWHEEVNGRRMYVIKDADGDDCRFDSYIEYLAARHNVIRGIAAPEELGTFQDVKTSMEDLNKMYFNDEFRKKFE